MTDTLTKGISLMTTYTNHSRDLLDQAHTAATDALANRVSQREELLSKLNSVDRQIVHLTNQQADFVTGLCRLDGLANTLMPTASVSVETTDPYVPNPFANVEFGDDRKFPERIWLTYEAMEQHFDIRALDDDCTLVAMSRGDLLAMIQLLSKKAKKGDAK